MMLGDDVVAVCVCVRKRKLCKKNESDKSLLISEKKLIVVEVI